MHGIRNNNNQKSTQLISLPTASLSKKYGFNESLIQSKILIDVLIFSTKLKPRLLLTFLPVDNKYGYHLNRISINRPPNFYLQIIIGNFVLSFDILYAS
jgi:hypothetical protein